MTNELQTNFKLAMKAIIEKQKNSRDDGFSNYYECPLCHDKRILPLYGFEFNNTKHIIIKQESNLFNQENKQTENQTIKFKSRIKEAYCECVFINKDGTEKQNIKVARMLPRFFKIKKDNVPEYDRWFIPKSRTEYFYDINTFNCDLHCFYVEMKDIFYDRKNRYKNIIDFDVLNICQNCKQIKDKKDYLFDIDFEKYPLHYYLIKICNSGYKITDAECGNSFLRCPLITKYIENKNLKKD